MKNFREQECRDSKTRMLLFADNNVNPDTLFFIEILVSFAKVFFCSPDTSANLTDMAGSIM